MSEKPNGHHSHLEIRTECADLVAKFYNFVDAGSASSIEALFCEGGVLMRGDYELKGDELRTVLAAREADVDRKTCPSSSGYSGFSELSR